MTVDDRRDAGSVIAQGMALVGAFQERCLRGVDTRNFRLIGVGNLAIRRGLSVIEAQTRRRVDNFQPRLPFTPYRWSLDLDERSAARGVVGTTVTTWVSLEQNPLLNNFIPDAHIGLAPVKMLLVDDRVLLLEGPPDARGNQVMWAVFDAAFVTPARDLRDACLHNAIRLAEVRESLTPRQYEIAQALCVGRTDAAMARQLGISIRSVERDVSVLLDYVGARSRTEAVARIMQSDTTSRLRVE